MQAHIHVHCKFGWIGAAILCYLGTYLRITTTFLQRKPEHRTNTVH
jgi:hypothetical protein